MSRDQLDRLLSLALIAAAVSFSVAVLHGQFAGSMASDQRATPAFMDDWEAALPQALHTGPSRAPVMIVEFVDFECPVCSHADTVLRNLKRELGDDLGLFFVHFPLDHHANSTQAALAAECSFEEGRFEEMSGAIFREQRWLGLKSWGAVALEAGIPDTTRIVDCMLEGRHLDRVQSGKQLGETMGIRGTPTLIVNGWRFDQFLTGRQLRNLVAEIRLGGLSKDVRPERIAAIISEPGDR